MRAVVQRVHRAAVSAHLPEGPVETGRVGAGLVVLVGVSHDDDAAGARRLADKLWGLRCFDDEHGRMNLSAEDVGAEVLVVSQFTLYGDTRRGRRPSYVDAAAPEHAEPLIEEVVQRLREQGATVATGRFGARMEVHLVGDGPVTLLLEV